jgi:undecaprenyl pyrophosphate phosphatase UppP
MEEILKAVLLGIVQGLTEFLPISSTAHLRIIPSFFGWKDIGASYGSCSPGRNNDSYHNIFLERTDAE